VPFSWAALPPLLAISRCLSSSIEAKPRFDVLELGVLAMIVSFLIARNSTDFLSPLTREDGAGSGDKMQSNIGRISVGLPTDRDGT